MIQVLRLGHPFRIEPRGELQHRGLVLFPIRMLIAEGLHHLRGGGFRGPGLLGAVLARVKSALDGVADHPRDRGREAVGEVFEFGSECRLELVDHVVRQVLGHCPP